MSTETDVDDVIKIIEINHVKTRQMSDDKVTRY